ncbi:hypothetical protein Tco_0693202 [Tanacetum coccineum]
MRTTSAITNHTFQTYFGKSTPTHDPIREFSHYFGPNQPGAESDCDLEDMEEEVEYITDDEVVMSEQEEIKPWGVENMKDALISIIKSIRQEMKDDIMKRQFEASTASVSDEYLPSPVTKWTKRIKTLQILHDMLRLKDEIAGPNSLSPGKRGLVKRWHVCKPIHVTYDDGSGEDCSGICFIDYKDECEMEFMDINDFLQIRYGQHKIDDTIQERRIGHSNLHGSDREFIFNEWILDSYDVKEEYAREIGGRSFICITDREDEALPLGRVNGARFKAMIRKELEGNNTIKVSWNKDAKTLWMQSSAGLDKTYDRFQKLISQLEIHGEVISQEDANLKLLRSLPSAWNNIALIMRNKSDPDTLSMDDLYNNLKVYESEIKGQSSSSSNSQNVAFVSLENTSSTNEAVNTAHDVTTASSQGQASSSTYVDDVMFSFFVNQSNSPQLDNEDLEQIDTNNLEEMDLKWQVAMLTMRVVMIFKKKQEKNLALKNQGNRNKDAPRRIIPVETPANALVVQDGIGGYDWSFQAEEGLTNFALMAYTSQVYQGLSNGIRILEAGRAFHQKSAAKTNNLNEKVKTSRVNNVTTVGPKAVVSAAVGNRENAVKSSACWIWRPTGNVIDHTSKDSGSYMLKRFDYGNPQYTLQDQGIFDSGCSRHMTGNKSFLIDYQEVDGGFVAFAGSPKGGKITGKGKIRTGKLDFEDVYFVKELKYGYCKITGNGQNTDNLRNREGTNMRAKEARKVSSKERPKEAQELQRCRIASLAIRVTNINPKAMIEDPMIGKDSRAEIKSKRSVC